MSKTDVVTLTLVLLFGLLLGAGTVATVCGNAMQVEAHDCAIWKR